LPPGKNVDGVEYRDIKNETLLKRGIQKDKYMRKYFPNDDVGLIASALKLILHGSCL